MVKTHPLMQMLLFGLRLNGVDPMKRAWPHKILMFFHLTSILSVFLINLLQLMLKWRGIETFGDVHLISSTSILAAKFIYLCAYQPKLRHLINTLNAFWSFDKFGTDTEARMHALIKRAMLVTKLFAAAVLGTAVSMLISGLLNRELIFPGYDVCDLKTSPCYEIHMAWQTCFCYLELCPVVLGFDGLFVSFIGYAYCDLEMIKVALRRMTLVIRKNHLPPEQRAETGEERALAKRNLMDIVEEHSRVMQFVKELNVFYNPMMLLHAGSSLFSLIFCLYTITLDGIPPKIEIIGRYGILLVAVVFQFFIFCYSGTVILEQGKSMEYHFYNVDWTYKTQPDFRRSIALMIEQAQATPKMKIGNMNDLNLESYLLVMRNGISAFTLMRTMADSDKVNTL